MTQKVLVYQFDDGNQISRVVDGGSTLQTYWVHAPESNMPFDEINMFRSKKSNKLIGMYRSKIPDSDIEKYRISFLMDVIGDDYSDSIAKKLIVYTDEFLDRIRKLDNNEFRKKLGRLIHSKDPTERQAGYEIAAVETTKLVKGIEMPKELELDIVIIDVIHTAGHELGWTIDGKHGNLYLLDSFKKYIKDMNIRLDVLPISQEEEWLRKNTTPGHIVFDVEPYILLDAEIPILYDDKEFLEWVSAIQ